MEKTLCLNEYRQFMRDNPKLVELDPHELPNDLSISTITLTCKLPVKFNVISIAKYLELSKTFIQSVMCGNNNEICRTLIPLKRKKKKTLAKSKKNFYNQVTIIVNYNEMCKFNVKLFKNGSLQLTGCKNISSVIWILSKLFDKLREPYITDNSETIRYAEPYIFMNIYDLYDLKIAMINSNFDIGFNIDREKLFTNLISDGHECIYDPSRHAGVNIRYTILQNSPDLKTQLEFTPSIFVFEKGSIIITGARNYMQIISCYKFINQYLITNYKKIVRQDILEN